MSHMWAQIWPNILSNILWVIPAFLVHRSVKLIRSLGAWVESVKHMEASMNKMGKSLEANTSATHYVKNELQEWRAEVAGRLLDLTERVNTLENRR